MGWSISVPALAFVLVFTAYPLVHMVWVSLHSWSLITPPKYLGLGNFARAFNDGQFWVSLLYTLKYTLYITPILMIGGYLIALATAENTPIKRFARGVVFMPVVVGLGVSSLLWFWLFSPEYGLINPLLIDLGLISRPILWLGVETETSTWAIIVSVVWKVIGFGMLLFVVAIQAIPEEVNEAAVIDGASYWQRVLRITLAADARVPCCW